MLRIDTRDLRRLERVLEATRKTALPYAIRNTLNDQAFAAHKEWQGEMESSFILRNRWTVGSRRVVRAKGKDIATMHSVVGSLASYLDEQEHGGTRHESAIPRPGAAGQPSSMRTRTRTVRARYRLKLSKKSQRKSAKKRLVYLSQPKLGVYEVWGRGKQGGRKIIWDLSHHTVHLRPTPTLGPAVETVRSKSHRMYARRMLQELRRVGWK